MGFALQKVAIRDQEKAKLEAVRDGESTDIAEIDNVNDGKHYCRCKWIIGMAILIFATTIQAMCLPLLNLTLLSMNAAGAIIMNIILST